MESDFGIALGTYKEAFPLLFRGGPETTDLGTGLGWTSLLWTLCAELDPLWGEGQ